MKFTTLQLLLLNNIMYMTPDQDRPFPELESFTGRPLSEWVNAIDANRIVDQDDRQMITASEWRNIIDALKRDKQIMKLKILTTYVDTKGGDGRSAVFVNRKSHEGIVVFKGTQGPAEWLDNFKSANLTDSPLQKNALEWYQDVCRKYHIDKLEVTVTGHSKGGNKAKYITILDPSVDHCVSFDGQGFSDLFMRSYSKNISERQEKIDNHNVEYDYVNLLLNDIGEQHWYKHYNIGNRGFLENHSPNAFMHFDDEGNLSMEEAENGRSVEMEAFDNFLNNYLRSMPSFKIEQPVLMVCELFNYAKFVAQGIDKETINDYLEILIVYPGAAAYMAAYTIQYIRANPEMIAHVIRILHEFNMDQYIETVEKSGDVILGKKKIMMLSLDRFLEVVGGVNMLMPGISTDLLKSRIRSSIGIKLESKMIMDVISILRRTRLDLSEITITDNGLDIVIPRINMNKETTPVKRFAFIRTQSVRVRHGLARVIRNARHYLSKEKNQDKGPQ